MILVNLEEYNLFHYCDEMLMMISEMKSKQVSSSNPFHYYYCDEMLMMISEMICSSPSLRSAIITYNPKTTINRKDYNEYIDNNPAASTNS